MDAAPLGRGSGSISAAGSPVYSWLFPRILTDRAIQMEIRDAFAKKAFVDGWMGMQIR